MGPNPNGGAPVKGITKQRNVTGLCDYHHRRRARYPGLPYSATLGRRIAMGPNPNGVAPLVKGITKQRNVTGCVTTSTGRKPFRVATTADSALATRPLPRVAEYGNPGL